MSRTLLNEMLFLETRKGNTRDRFEAVHGRHIQSETPENETPVLVLVFDQLDGRVDPDTNTQARRRWVAVSTPERVQRGDEALSAHIIHEDRVAAKEEE